MSSNPPNLDVGRMAMEGLGQMMNSVQRAWTHFDLPTAFTPTLSLADLDKRIADLRAIEQWLALNQNMLRGTIQGLEIQRGTLHAVQSLSDTIGKAVQPPDDQVAQSVARVAADAARAASARGAGGRDGFGNPFDPGALLRLFGPLGAFADVTPAGGASSTDVPPAPAPAPAATAPAASAVPPVSPPPAASPPPSEPEGNSPLIWWDLLQQNFRRLAEAAVAGTTATGHAGPGGEGGKAAAASPPAAAGRPAGAADRASPASSARGRVRPAKAGPATDGKGGKTAAKAAPPAASSPASSRAQRSRRKANPT